MGCRRLHLVGQPTLLLFLSLEVVGAVAHRAHTIESVDGIDHGWVGDVNRDAIQPFRWVDQLGTTAGHRLKILWVDGDVVFVDGNAKVGTTLQSTIAQVSLRVVDGIRRIVLVFELYPVDVGRDLRLGKHRDYKKHK